MKRFLRVLGWSFGGIAVLLGVFHLEENWRGKRAWEKWKAERIAKGDRYDWSDLVPPAVPDADNFAKEPMVEAAITGRTSLLNGFTWGDKAPKFANWRLGQREDVQAWAASFKSSDLETGLKPIQQRLDELVQASKRPGCRMPCRYQYPEMSEDPVVPLLGFRAASRMLRLRASARLQAGDAAGAFEDALAGLRLARQFQNDPVLMSNLLEQAMSGIAMQPVWDGLATHAWTEPQLAELQAELGRIDLILSFRRAIQSERVFSAQAEEAEARRSSWQQSKAAGWSMDSFDAPGEVRTDWLKAIRVWLLIPNGWTYQSLRQVDRYYAEGFLPGLDPGAHVIHLGAIRRADALNEGSFFNRMRGVASGMLASQSVRAALHQNALDEARIVCALERYRLAHGAYPATLDELVPAYLDRVPVDVLEGGALRYRLESPTVFHLYSVGPDGQDNGGQVATGKEGSLDIENGDWTWPQPAK